MLLSLSRIVVGLVGTKKACGQGGCGACTVMVSRINRLNNKILYPSYIFDFILIFKYHLSNVVTDFVPSVTTLCVPCEGCGFYF